MSYLAVKNLAKYQHYKKRRPPWVKLYQSILEDLDFIALPDASKWLALGLLLIASRYDNHIPFDCNLLAKLLHTSEEINLQPLLSFGYLVEVQGDTRRKRASKTIARRKQDVSHLVQRTENRVQSTDTTNGGVSEVLAHYVHAHPKRRPGPKDARLVERALGFGYSVADLCEAITGNAVDPWHAEKRKHELAYILRDNGKIDDFRARAVPTLTPRQQYLRDNVLIDEFGVLTPAGDWLTSPEPQIIAERRRRGIE